MGKEERRLYDTGHIGWIRKPFGMADLAAYVRSVLDGAALSGEILGDGLQE
jgi:DNA-binding response OmpR family regulator